jgi:hypothetical protein
MKCVLSRKYVDNETQGAFVIFDGCEIIYQCVTIELPDLNNKQGISCIPEGIYNVEKYDSTTKGECFWVKDVPDRTSILIHKGNYAAGKKVDTLGCILPGSKFSDINWDGALDVIESTITMKKLLEVLPEKFKLHII